MKPDNPPPQKDLEKQIREYIKLDTQLYEISKEKERLTTQFWNLGLAVLSKLLNKNSLNNDDKVRIVCDNQPYILTHHGGKVSITKDDTIKVI